MLQTVTMATWTLRLTLLVAVITVTSATIARCPSTEWHRFREMCYWRSNSTLIWNQVRNYCQMNFPGSDMVSIHDLELDAFIAEELLYYDQAWLGLRRASNSSPWTWTDGSDCNYYNFFGGDPAWADETCTLINVGNPGCWTGLSCDHHYHYFVCQIATS